MLWHCIKGITITLCFDILRMFALVSLYFVCFTSFLVPSSVTVNIGLIIKKQPCWLTDVCPSGYTSCGDYYYRRSSPENTQWVH